MIKRFFKFLFRFILVLVLVIALAIGGWYAYVRHRMTKDGVGYTDAVEHIILDFVPDGGVTVRGRTYDYWSMQRFLEEIRYDPYNYVHKDHHCVLQYVPQEKIYWIVSALRLGMGLGW